MTDPHLEINKTINHVNVEYKKIVDSFKAAQKALQEEFRKSAEVMFRSIFTHAPNLHMLCWTQYQNYFNDGEECTFNVHEIYAVRNTYLGSEEEDDLGEYPNPNEIDGSVHHMQKPSSWVFDNRDKYSSYEAECRIFEALDKNERLELDLVTEFIKTMSSIPDDIMLAMFGNHCAVYVTRSGIVVEEHEHD